MGVCLVAFTLVSCEGDAGRGRVLLIGIDGATLRVIAPMLERGELPNLARIGQTGTSGRLRAHLPLRSPRIWTSIATGMHPRKHRITGFARPALRGKRRLFISSDRRGPALWNIASFLGMTVAVINWWTTYPVEKIRGVMVSDHLHPAHIGEMIQITGAISPDRGPVIWPPDWAQRIKALQARDERLAGIADPFSDLEVPSGWTPPEALSRYASEDETVARIALEVEGEIRPGLMMVFFPGIDRVSHFLWGGLEPPSAYSERARMSESAREWSAQALFRYYAFTDALIGRLAERYDQKDLIMIVSDHGFEAGESMSELTGAHDSRAAIDGIVFARGPGIRSVQADRIMSVNDVTPTILAWLGLPAAEEMDGQVAEFLERPEIPGIPAYDAEVERLEDLPSGSEDTMLEELRTLGYLETDESE